MKIRVARPFNTNKRLKKQYQDNLTALKQFNEQKDPPSVNVVENGQNMEPVDEDVKEILDVFKKTTCLRPNECRLSEILYVAKIVVEKPTKDGLVEDDYFLYIGVTGDLKKRIRFHKQHFEKESAMHQCIRKAKSIKFFHVGKFLQSKLAENQLILITLSEQPNKILNRNLNKLQFHVSF